MGKYASVEAQDYGIGVCLNGELILSSVADSTLAITCINSTVILNDGAKTVQ